MKNEAINITLEPKGIAACTDLPPQLAFMGRALQHQVDVFDKAVNHNIIVNSSSTGTGKTKAAFTVLLHEKNRNRHAIYVAPTNALIEQQKSAAEKFIKQADLSHVVIEASAKDIRSWPSDRVGIRPGEKIYNLLRNPATIFPELGSNRPVLLITNPDIFYYATFFAYRQLDRVNIASKFYSQFSTVIFDEFHLYDAKQLIGLLFYMALSHEFGYFNHGRRIILLTATPEPACESTLESLSRQGVKIAYVDGESTSENLLPSQTTVNLCIRPQPDRDQLILEISRKVQRNLKDNPDNYGAVILDSLDQINQLSDELQSKGLGREVGRITGPSPLADRQRAAQCKIILATSTVDVGFNFERNPTSERQPLDWIIFSAQDRAAFWQRIGRVGRVLGRSQTDISSVATAYLPEKAWEQNISSLNGLQGREALEQKLLEVDCLDRPFLSVYWQSEAFVEIARPFLILENMMDGLAESELLSNLYQTIKNVLGGKRDWKYYKQRMQALQAAESIAQHRGNDAKNPPLKFIKGNARWAIVTAFLKAECPEDWEELKAGKTNIRDYEEVLSESSEAITAFRTFCKKFSVSYSPLFGFRSSLFKSLDIKDPRGFLLDVSDKTVIDPIHLLRYYEFSNDQDTVELVNRAAQPYQVSFRLRYYDNSLSWKSDHMNKLQSFENCHIERRRDGALSPTPLLSKLERELIPGAIICPVANAYAYYQSRKDRIVSYPITVVGNNFEKEYVFFPGLSGILTLALYGTRLKLPDEEEFLYF